MIVNDKLLVSCVLLLSIVEVIMEVQIRVFEMVNDDFGFIYCWLMIYQQVVVFFVGVEVIYFGLFVDVLLLCYVDLG